MSLRAVQLWIGISVLASLAGWTLSALGELNRLGYAVFFSVAFVAALLHRPARESLFQFRPFNWTKLRRRFCRPLPLSFVILAALILLGGALYPPGNHTALTYRIPRVLQWLAHEQWFWIHTENYRMNNRACGIEWLSAPLLLFTKSDRGLFLLNFIPYLLLPGLFFSLCTRLGVRARVAWQWMWLLPAGYCFLLQAGGTANDAFPTVYALAMMVFGFRAWNSKKFSDLAFSVLSAALLVGAKASNLPLLLPWAILMMPALLRWFRADEIKSRPTRPVPRILFLISLFFISALVSFLPTALLNIRYCGDWSGLSLEVTGMEMKNPLVGLWGNALLLLVNNFVPPFFPLAGWWNHHVLSLLPGFIVAPMSANFEAGYLTLWELPTEDWAGLGFGLSLLLAVSIFVSRFKLHVSGRAERSLFLRRALLVTPWLALAAYCAKSGMVTPARLIAPYYPLLLPLLLTGAGHSMLIRRRWWRWLVWGNFLLALGVLIVTPPRPLWPAKTILAKAAAMKPGQRLLERAQKVYSVYAGRPDPLAGARALLPPELPVVGFLGGPDDMDISLWRPYGSRRVEHILPKDAPEQIRRRGIEYAVVDEFALRDQQLTLADWMQQSGAIWIASTNITVKISTGPQTWHIVRFE